MKKILMLTLGFLLITTFVFADVTAEIIGKEIDENGNIRIKTAYWIDGVNVESRYPKVTIKDKDEKDISVYYWVTRYNVISFSGMDATQIQVRIDQDITSFAENLITKPFQIQLNNDLKTANDTLFKGELLSGVVGHKVTTASAKMIVDSNFDGVEDKEWTVKSDMTKTEKDYVAPVTP